jgi:hydroxymethylglutaryl-CoA lyase
MMMKHIRITETPRDAMQGWKRLIPPKEKIEYINALLRVGFDKVDVGSFVSPRAIPQMADTAEVVSKLETKDSESKIMVIVGNRRGALQAAEFSKIQVLGFPYSVSPSFLKRNLNTTPGQAWDTIRDLEEICISTGKHLQVYLAMAFGNPYGDPWNDDLVMKESENLVKLGIKALAFSDITGESSPESIGRLCSRLVEGFPGIELSLHLHSSPLDWQPKIEAAWDAGFRNFEGALGGFGGCPMSGYELLGNLDTANLVEWCKRKKILFDLNEVVLSEAKQIGEKIFT